jgi:hypothetical protein
MEAAVECTHCRVVMTSWSAPGSPIRYYQCPFCTRTHSSLYGEVFRRRAGARLIEGSERAMPVSAIPMASPDDARWARVKQTAARWFARIDADERLCATTHAPAAPVGPRSVSGARPAYPPRRGGAGVHANAPPPRGLRAVADDGLAEIDPDDVVEIAAPAVRRSR